MTLAQFLQESADETPYKDLLMFGAKGLYEAWWVKIKEIDPDAEPFTKGPSKSRYYWHSEWYRAIITVNSLTSQGQVFLSIVLVPRFDDDGKFIGTHIHIGDSEIPKSWQKRGLFSVGLKWLVDNKEKIQLDMNMGVHVSTNDAVWEALAKKFGLNWERQ